MIHACGDRHPHVAVLIGMVDGDPFVEVFSDLDRAVEYGALLNNSGRASLRIETRYVDLIVDEEGEA